MSQNQPHPSFFSLAARITLAIAIGIVLALLDSTSPRMMFFGLRISGITTVAIVMIVLLALSILFDGAFWRDADIRWRRLVGFAILSVIILVTGLLPTQYSIVLILFPMPMVAAFIARYPGEPAYTTARFAVWCGVACWTGIGIAWLYRILSLPGPDCTQTHPCRLFLFDPRGFFFAVPFAWLFTLAFAQLLAVYGVSLRFMKAVGKLEPSSDQYAKRRAS